MKVVLDSVSLCGQPLQVLSSTTIGYTPPEQQDNQTLYLCLNPLPCPIHGDQDAVHR